MSSNNSKHYTVVGSGGRPYTVTINFETGHWCERRGMISMKRKHKHDAGKSSTTSCKHIKNIINKHFDGNWKEKGEKISSPVVNFRRFAVEKQKKLNKARHRAEKQSSESLTNRIAALEAERG